MTRKAKIVCTIGPASNSDAVLRDLVRSGMDVARLNFSHGTHEEHARRIERLRRAAQREGRSLGILQDLCGPKIRTGRLKSRAPVALKAGAHLTITPRDLPGTASLLSTTFTEVTPQLLPLVTSILASHFGHTRLGMTMWSASSSTYCTPP